MTPTRWHPRGGPTWPTFRDAVPGVTRVRHVRSRRAGTFVRWPRKHPRRTNSGYAVIRWDADDRWPEVTGRVVAYAFELEEITLLGDAQPPPRGLVSPP